MARTVTMALVVWLAGAWASSDGTERFSSHAAKNTCDPSEDYHRLVHHRIRHWINDRQDFTYLREHDLWQAALDNKLIGYFFARAQGVNTPPLYACEPQGVNHLPATFPDALGSSYVVKPGGGWI